VTQIFDRKSKYLENDSVFAVKDNLVVDFEHVQAGKDSRGGQADLELVYNINLAPAQ